MRRQSILVAAILYNWLPIYSVKKGWCQMKWFNDSKITLLLLAFAVALMLTAASSYADFTFGTPTKLGPPLNSFYDDSVGCISADGLEMYLDTTRPGGFGDEDIWVAKRDTTDANWGAPANLGPMVNSAGDDLATSIAHDGLELYFASYNRAAGYGGYDIWVTRRATKHADWGPPVNLGPTVNGPAEDVGPCISGDGLELYFFRGTYGGAANGDILVTRRETKNRPWSAPVNIGPVVNSPGYNEAWPCLSANGLLLFFSDVGLGGPFRPGGFGGEDIWVTTRATTDDDWAIPRNIGPPVNSSLHEDSPILSADGSTLYFHRGPGGGGAFNYETFDIWQSPIVPIVDFNGDGNVNMKDFSRLAQYWRQNEPSVDIGPTPLGDHAVDIQDVAVLAKYWLTEVLPVDLVAYWKLDETEGSIAHDSAGANDGALNGNPIWQATGGKVNGALEFDGIDDYVSTPFVLNPSAWAFSVFAWVKGGAGPGQVIISQQSGVNWLAVIQVPGLGWLMTDVSAQGGGSLISQAVITDGNWHRVGLTWDGKNRILYVDDVEVAKDTQSTVAPADGGLHIGAGKNLEAGSFWSGLIDDVRIYNRAITP